MDSKRKFRDSTSIVIRQAIELGPILVVEDDPMFARLIRKRLEMNKYEVIVATDGIEGLELARLKKPDLIISDWMMPRMDGATLCEAIREDPELETIYFILLSSRSDTSEKVEGLERGADDYLTKTADYEELLARVRAGMRIRALQHELRRQATLDPLTGLANRRSFFSRLTDEMGRTRRYSHPLSVAMIDLDHLKTLNDTHGHLAGDEALRRVGVAITDACRETDTIARIGGDEFAVLFPGADEEMAELAMRRVQVDLTETRLAIKGELIPLKLSFGVAQYDPRSPMKPENLVEMADERLYAMKRKHHQPA